jgi:AraC-like DNA-binding protein
MRARLVLAIDADPEFLHYFPVPPAKRSKNPNSPSTGFAARIDLKDPCVPITSRHIQPLGVAYNYLHRHPEFEICYFPHDSGTFMIQDREYPIQRGDIFIVNANDIHQPILRNERNDGALVVYFSPRLFGDASEGAEWLHAFMLASLLGRNRIRTSARLRELIEELHETLHRQKPHWQLAARGLLTHVLSIIACNFLQDGDSAQSVGHVRSVQRFTRVIGYINENLHQRIKATQLHALASLSHSQFSEKFLESFGVSVTGYIRLQRLRRARRLLQSTSLTITQIALQTGFPSSSFFSTVFKKHTGLSPARFRKAMPLATSTNTTTPTRSV